MEILGTVRKRAKNWFYSYNAIFDYPISEHAKIAYLYLCRCADADGQSFPSYNTIGEKCSFSRRTAIRAITELLEIGLLEKYGRIKEDGEQTSNLYYINEPAEGGSATQSPPPVPHSHHPSATQSPEGLPIKGHNKDDDEQHDPIDELVKIYDESAPVKANKKQVDRIRELVKINGTDRIKEVLDFALLKATKNPLSFMETILEDMELTQTSNLNAYIAIRKAEAKGKLTSKNKKSNSSSSSKTNSATERDRELWFWLDIDSKEGR